MNLFLFEILEFIKCDIMKVVIKFAGIYHQIVGNYILKFHLYCWNIWSEEVKVVIL